MDDGLSRSDKIREHKIKKSGFIQSLKLDWSLLLKGLTSPRSWRFLKGDLSNLQFQESQPQYSIDDRLAQLSEAKKSLNLRIEKVNKQLELLQVTLKGLDDSPASAQLIQEGQKATREIQLLEAELGKLRREQKSRVKQALAAGTPDLRVR